MVPPPAFFGDAAVGGRVVSVLQVISKGELHGRLSSALSTPSDGQPGRAWVEGLSGSSRALHVAALRRTRTVVLCEDLEDALRFRQDLVNFLPAEEVELFPGPDVVEGRILPLTWQELIHRLRSLTRLVSRRPIVTLAPLEGFLAFTMTPGLFSESLRTVRTGDSCPMESLIGHLVRLGYRRVANTEVRGEFSVRGGIVDVFVPSEPAPVRIELFGDQAEEIRSYDPSTQRSRAAIESIIITPVREILVDDELLAGLSSRTDLPDHLRALVVDAGKDSGTKGVEALLPLTSQCASLADYLEPDDLLVSTLPPRALSRIRGLYGPLYPDGWVETVLSAVGRVRFLTFTSPPVPLAPLPMIRTECALLPGFAGQIPRMIEVVKEHLLQGNRVIFAVSTQGNSGRIREIFTEREIPATTGIHEGEEPVVSIVRADLESGFFLPEQKLIVLSENDVWRSRELKSDGVDTAEVDRAVSFSDFAEIEKGSLVVHFEHGIGRFLGLTTLLIGGVKQEFLELEYAKGDKLFVPVSQLDRVQKFIGVEEGKAPSLNRLGSQRWQTTRSKMKGEIEEMAKKLLDLYAKREIVKAHPHGPDTVWQKELEESFGFEETRDQKTCVAAIKKDLSRDKPTDRLVCGDVGYGKTEVAIRAAFKTVQENRQVAILVPTTILAQQHFHTISQRLAAFPVTVGVLSRLRTKPQQEETLKKLGAGRIDIIIGTHRLLSSDVAFADLGLLVIDEEQRFGVKHKERIKELKAGVHVITLTATPIPRTLNLSLGGLRDISVITTPPKGRIPIKTFVLEYDEEVVRGAILREIERKGQVYYVYNRILSMEAIESWLAKIVPEARIRCGHGQMSREELERLMDDFYEGRFDVLVSTTIIESGLDIPNVNTIIVHEASTFGLSQLYQLRGRVGRSNKQAFAYFLFPARTLLTELAYQRLKALEEHTELGAGFRIAMRDLELRGAGNILGGAQHGFIHTVGLEMYTRLLREAVATVKNRPDLAPIDLPKVELAVDLLIPPDYIQDVDTRILFYRRLAEVTNLGELEEAKGDLRDRFGPVPERLDGLFRLIRLRLRASQLGVREIKQQAEKVMVSFDPARPIPQDFVDRLLKEHMRRITFAPGSPSFTVDLGLRKNLAVLTLLEQVLDIGKLKEAPTERGCPLPGPCALNGIRIDADAAPGPDTR